MYQMLLWSLNLLDFEDGKVRLTQNLSADSIENVVTPRSRLTKEKNEILSWHIWVAKQLTFRPFLMNGFLLLFYETVYLSAYSQPN